MAKNLIRSPQNQIVDTVGTRRSGEEILLTRLGRDALPVQADIERAIARIQRQHSLNQLFLRYFLDTHVLLDRDLEPTGYLAFVEEIDRQLRVGELSRRQMWAMIGAENASLDGMPLDWTWEYVTGRALSPPNQRVVFYPYSPEN